MKYMKLGSKPDAFHTDGDCIRYVASDLATDVVVFVGDKKFYLHKFPLMSKSNHLQKLITKANEEGTNEVHMLDFPGGTKAFEICAKFCYGTTVTLNAYNVVAARCAAEYLEMTEDLDRGNLISKIEIFLNSSIFRSWKDSIIALQATKSLLPWSEDLKVLGRCINSIALKTSLDPSHVNWSYTYNRKLAVENEIYETGVGFQGKIQTVSKDWWVEDICELEIDLYKQVMIAVKVKGRTSNVVIGEALKVYAVRWLPNSVTALVSHDYAMQSRTLVETIIWLLPADRGVSCSCGFLLKLLKVAVLVAACDASKEELMKRISLRLDEASVSDLLIPLQSPGSTVYDVGLVHNFVKRFVLQNQSTLHMGNNEKNETCMGGDILRHGSCLTVGKLIDGYLTEIASDQNLSLPSFISLSQLIPESARPVHDGLYKSIDIYLKEHPSLTKSERKKICALMDVKKFTMDACMHAAQNDRLPLRVVVQVLFFEQGRATAGSLDSPHNIPAGNSCSSKTPDEDWEVASPDNYNSLKKEMKNMEIGGDDCQDHEKRNKNSSRRSGGFLLSSRSRRIIDRFWVVGKGNGDYKGSETSDSSQSAASSIPGETKSSGSFSRHR